MGAIESTQVGQYEVLGPLGSGGLGSVYRGRHVVTGQEVALKAVSPGQGTDVAQAQAMLLREASVLSRVASQHRTFVQIYDVLIDDDTVIVVRELIDGVALGAWQRGRSAREVVGIYVVVARALEVLHGHGVAVRALKPSNVVVDRDGQPHIVDFGLAVHLDETDVLTGVATLVGDVLYMAPEAISGKALDAAADIYALGLMLLEALTGQNARSGGLSTIMADMLDAKPIEALDRLREAPFAKLQGELERMLSREPEQRPSAQHVAGVLDTWLQRRAMLTKLGFGKAIESAAPIAYPVQSLDPIERPPARSLGPLGGGALPAWARKALATPAAVAAASMLLVSAGLVSSLKLLELDQAPEIGSMRALASKIVAGGEADIEVHAEDPEQRKLTYAYSSSEGRVAGDSKIATLYAPRRIRGRTITVRVVVRDPAGHSATEEIAIRANRPPQGQLLFSTEPVPGVPMRVQAAIVDPDGDTPRFFWVANPPVVPTGSKDTVIWTVPSHPGEYEIGCKVSDGFERIQMRRTFHRP